MASTLTITGKVGPAAALTSAVFNNVTFFSIDTTNEILDVAYNNGDGAQRVQIDISAQTTLTLTVSGNAYSLTIT